MRISGAKKVHYDSGPNMTPLVDVVMVILIFLMLAGSFGGVEHYLVSNLPVKKSGGGKSDKKPFEDTQIDIRVDGSFRADNPNYWIARAGKVETSDPKLLRAGLEQKRLELEAIGTKPDKMQVIINPNRSVKWQSLIVVYQAALEAGYTKVAFSEAH